MTRREEWKTRRAETDAGIQARAAEVVDVAAEFWEDAGFWLWECPTCRSSIAHKGAIPATVPAHCPPAGSAIVSGRFLPAGDRAPRFVRLTGERGTSASAQWDEVVELLDEGGE